MVQVNLGRRNILQLHFRDSLLDMEEGKELREGRGNLWSRRQTSREIKRQGTEE